MIDKVVLAANNQGKLAELKVLLEDLGIEVLSLKDINFIEEIEETGNTLHQNSLIKASTIFNYCKMPVIADDSGLFVEFLDGQPGVESAYFAGKPSNPSKNNQKLLSELINAENRNAAFKCCLCFINQEGQEFYFEGEVQGKIASSQTGKEGFGYDPLFVPIGFDRSFADLGVEIKNKLSHRKMAFNKLKEFLLNLAN